MEIDSRALEAYLGQLLRRDVRITQLSDLGGTTGAAAIKAFGYGRPLRVEYAEPGAAAGTSLVLRRINRNGFGRERDSDRIAEAWLDWSTWSLLERHVAARDLVALKRDGSLASLADVADVLLLTEYAGGQPYAEDLARIRDTGAATPLDLERAVALAGYLAEIHAVKQRDPLLWRRRLRDLVGHGEGIMGLTDSYPADFALATPDDLRAIEAAANRWRWRLKPLDDRLSQVHGDFHPFNVLFGAGTEFRTLDRSRGAWGEPADDVSCMTINYLFFALQRDGAFGAPFRQLYDLFWDTYLAHSHDAALSAVIQPWFAWRALVLASPQWYPGLAEGARRTLLRFARRVLACERFEWAAIERYLEEP